MSIKHLGKSAMGRVAQNHSMTVPPNIKRASLGAGKVPGGEFVVHKTSGRTMFIPDNTERGGYPGLPKSQAGVNLPTFKSDAQNAAELKHLARFKAREKAFMKAMGEGEYSDKVRAAMSKNENMLTLQRMKRATEAKIAQHHGGIGGGPGNPYHDAEGKFTDEAGAV